MNSKPEEISELEWKCRIDLAACYRLAHINRWADHIYTHFSARVPGESEYFLINPWGLTFDEVTATNLLKLDMQGRLVNSPAGHDFNHAGYVIHSAVYQARADVGAVFHTHTPAGIAVSAQRDGLRNYSQHSARFHGRVGYHDYHGFAEDEAEQARIAQALGPHAVLIMRNHGLVATGPDVATGFQELFELERACTAQLAIQSAGVPLQEISDVQANDVAQWIAGRRNSVHARNHWQALLRQLERLQITYTH